MKNNISLLLFALLALMSQVGLAADVDCGRDNYELIRANRMVSKYESGTTETSPEEDKRLTAAQQITAAYGGAALGAVVGMIVAPRILIGDKEVDSLGIGMYLSYLIGEIVGVSVGSSGMLYLADRSSSFWWMSAGATLSAVVFTIVGFSTRGGLESPLLLGGFAAPAGAIVAYNLTTRKGRGESQSLLEISGHRLTAYVPTPYIRIEVKETNPPIEYRISILTIHFE